jgi:hypothetical protein
VAKGLHLRRFQTISWESTADGVEASIHIGALQLTVRALRTRSAARLGSSSGLARALETSSGSNISATPWLEMADENS